jgi:hypothetical protein
MKKRRERAKAGVGRKGITRPRTFERLSQRAGKINFTQPA